MKKVIQIAPSLLSANFGYLADEVTAVTKAGADLIHLDIMDGHFVPNLTIGPGVIKALRQYCNLPFDVHLMISDADKYVPAFADAGADIITVHIEAASNIHKSIELIHSCGKKAGIAINPNTSVETAEDILSDIDLILVMTVNPGFGGQLFMESQLKKIRDIRKKIDLGGYDVALEVDGGINAENASLVIDSGATILVAGTAVFTGNKTQYEKNILALRGGS